VKYLGLYFVILFVLIGCSKGPKSQLLSENSEFDKWGDTIQYVLPNEIGDVTEEINSNELFGVETSTNKAVSSNGGSEDIKEALASTVESIIRMSGRIPQKASTKGNGTSLVINKFKCKSTIQYTQQLVVVQSKNTYNDDDGSSVSQSEHCIIILSQTHGDSLIIKKKYEWKSTSHDESGDYVDRVIADFMSVKE